MKLKQAYGHPSYNNLIRAFHNQRVQNRQLITLVQNMCKGWMREMTPCMKCHKDWA